MWSRSWNENWQGRPKYYGKKKHAPMPLFVPQIYHGLTSNPDVQWR
jgi:hypothetical protein